MTIFLFILVLIFIAWGAYDAKQAVYWKQQSSNWKNLAEKATLELEQANKNTADAMSYIQRNCK